MKDIPNIIFLCTGNSCRSQMAEGWCRFLYPEKFNAYSAGIKAHGINPYAIKVMNEVGIDITNHTSDLISKYDHIKMNLVVTVCDNAKENCPYIPAKKTIHHSFDDPPALAQNLQNEEEILAIYRKVRDQIGILIKDIKNLLSRES